jgi:hypothetical protein
MTLFLFKSGVAIAPTLYFVFEAHLELAWETFASWLQVEVATAKKTYLSPEEVSVEPGSVIQVSDASRCVDFVPPVPEEAQVA